MTRKKQTPESPAPLTFDKLMRALVQVPKDEMLSVEAKLAAAKAKRIAAKKKSNK